MAQCNKRGLKWREESRYDVVLTNYRTEEVMFQDGESLNELV